jgi:hypothetical protein
MALKHIYNDQEPKSVPNYNRQIKPPKMGRRGREEDIMDCLKGLPYKPTFGFCPQRKQFNPRG